MNFIEMISLSLIEGLTEFLPVSSTGHLIVLSWLFGIQEEGFVKSFNIIIQFGAILSVLAIYWPRFVPKKKNFEFYKRIFIAFLPAAVIGLLVKKKIDFLLENVYVVAAALIVGGIILIWSDRFFKKQNTTGRSVEQLSTTDCLKLGLIQCFAFIPGVSRSAATIIGGLWLGMNRKQATEFSFFLAVPTLTGAALVKSLGAIKEIQTSQNLMWLILGCIFSFLFAWAAIRFFINFVSKHGFTGFGIYRILVGIIVFAVVAARAIL